MPELHHLHNLLNLGVSPSAPGILIYAETLTPRLHYTCEFIFNHVLKLSFRITSDWKLWQESGEAKINYSTQSSDAGLCITPGGLLSEAGISATKPEPSFRDGQFYFYSSGSVSTGSLHFDVFAAVFYFISRYEEWQPFERDAHGRFEAKASLLYKLGKHLAPVVDQWVYELKSSLQQIFPGLAVPAVAFKAIGTIDVDNLFAYRHKGFFRTAGACAKDVLKLDFKNLALRLQAVMGSKKDPFDVYEELCAFGREEHLPLLFFFLYRTGTRYDRTVPPGSPAFKRVFSLLKNNGALFGLHPSYDSAFEAGRMEQEVKQLSEDSGTAVTLSRQHFLRFDIASTPQLLLKSGIRADFSMGFASSPGFRAGTSQPFYYYDLKNEKKEELLLVPFCAMDGAYVVYDNASADTTDQSLWSLAQEIKKVNGLFVTVFHERTFSDHLYRGFGPLYKNLHLRLKEL